MTYYCARIVRPHERTGGHHKNPLCGILGLPTKPSMAYVGDTFCLPVVGGPREFIEPAEWSSRAAAEASVATHHQTGLAFDWPVPKESVQWQLRLYHNYDGSRRHVASDLPWETFRIYWLAALGLSQQHKAADVQVMCRLQSSYHLRMPEGYTLEECSGWQTLVDGDLDDKPGAVDALARLLGGWS